MVVVNDWIMIRIDLSDDPRVLEMAELLAIEPETVVGRLVSVWGYFNRHTSDGCLKNVQIMSVASRTKVGQEFLQAMVSVGWLEQSNGALRVHEFDRYNSKSGKRRVRDAERKRTERYLNCPQSVHDLSAKYPQPKKRKEEGNTAAPPGPSGITPALRLKTPADAVSTSERVENSNGSVPDINTMVYELIKHGINDARNWKDEAVLTEWLRLKQDEDTG